MLKGSIASILIYMVLMTGCNHSIDTKDPGNDSPTASDTFTAEISSTGGTLGSDSIGITIPADAFEEPTILTLCKAPDSVSSKFSTLTSLFKLSGLPEVVNTPFQIKLKAPPGSIDSMRIAIGEISKCRSNSDTTLKFTLLEPSDSSGYLSIFLGPIDSGDSDASVAIGKRSEKLGVIKSDIYIGIGQRWTKVVQERFKVHYTASINTQEQADAIKKLFENIYSFYEDSMNFSMSKYTRWPVDVYLTKTDLNANGDPNAGEYSRKGYFSKPYFNINDELAKSSDLSDIQITVGHEFLHFIQDIYYGFRLSGGSEWFDEATTSFMEKYFQKTPSSSFIPMNTKGYFQQPFLGFQSGWLKGECTPDQHGYGMALVMEYLLSGPDGKTGIKNFIDKITDGVEPLEAIKQDYGAYDLWLTEFYRSVIEGQVYNTQFSLAPVNKLRLDTTADTSTSHHFNDTYYDLSCNIYRIQPLKVNPETKLKIVATGIQSNKIKVLVYKINGKTLVLDQEKDGDDTITITDLSKYTRINITENVSWFPVLVVNKTCMTYASSNKIALIIKTIIDTSPRITSILPQEAFPGDEVTIKGKYFGFPKPEGSGVTFNGVAMNSYTVWNDTMIICTVPSGATSGTVVVSSNALKSEPFTYEVGSFQDVTLTIAADTTITVEALLYNSLIAFDVHVTVAGTIIGTNASLSGREDFGSYSAWSADIVAPGSVSYDISVQATMSNLTPEITGTRNFNDRLCKFVAQLEPIASFDIEETYNNLETTDLMTYLSFTSTSQKTDAFSARYTCSMTVPQMSEINALVTSHAINPFQKALIGNHYLKAGFKATVTLSDATTDEFIETFVLDEANYILAGADIRCSFTESH